mmetsp:Transcript_38395/g.115034  ORF Transcript_38395/g.115034 Transcript_38395/m.115034 type:complete len:104 (-) Transcript_38395:91-402(-)
MVPVLCQQHFEEQMNAASSFSLMRKIVVDVPKRILYLPKVTDLFRKDFGQGNPFDAVQYCLQFLDQDTQASIIDMLNNDANNPQVKFLNASDQFHSNLTVMAV